MTHGRVHRAWCWEILRADRGGMASRIGAIAWGALFVWVGIALLADVGWGVALVGIGSIALGAQAARWHFRLRLEAFWLLVGTGLTLAGSLRLVGVTQRLVPVLLMAAGLALVAGGVFPGRSSDRA